jgi:hypothetical protein
MRRSQGRFSSNRLRSNRSRVAPLLRLFAVLLIHTTGSAFGDEALSDVEVREVIIRESIAAYQATGHPCAGPYNIARNGSQCGHRSAYSRPGGAEPLCYPGDVSDGMILDWRRSHRGSDE